jgi:hypothetical protein
MKIHMSRSIASTINPSYQRRHLHGQLQHLAVSGSTLTVTGVTLMVDDSTLTVDGGNQMSDDQHRLGSVVVGMTWLRHHQAKQHPQYE